MITVNGETIPPDLIESTFSQIKSVAEAHSETSCCEHDAEFLKSAEDQTIKITLLSQEAEHRIPELKKAEIRSALEDTLREWRKNGASWEFLEAKREDLRNEVISSLRMERFTEQVWQGLPSLSEQDLVAWHHSHPEVFRKPARAKVLHLLHFPEKDKSSECYRSLVALRHEILEGADFAETAIRHTHKEKREIDLGWIDHERVLDAFEVILFSLREKELSPVFFYEQAFHLIWIESLQAECITPYEEVAERVREFAQADQQRQALNQLAEQLLETANIHRSPQ